MLKILFAVDGSESSLRAARQLAKSVSGYKQTPEVHMVVVHLPVPLAGKVTHTLGTAVLENYYNEGNEVALKEARKILTLAGIVAIEHTLVGDPAATLVELARTQGCDQLYMGTRGMGAVKSLVLGSTAQKVLHLTDIPVVLVH